MLQQSAKAAVEPITQSVITPVRQEFGTFLTSIDVFTWCFAALSAVWFVFGGANDLVNTLMMACLLLHATQFLVRGGVSLNKSRRMRQRLDGWEVARTVAAGLCVLSILSLAIWQDPKFTIARAVFKG